MASIEQLTQNLTDISQPIATRRAAVIELGDIGGTQTLPILLSALTDVAPSVRREAANALQKCHFSEATPALVDALNTEDSDLTRWTFIEALGNIGTASALPVLESLLTNEVSPLTRREVQKSIDLIAERHPHANAAEMSEPFTESTEQIAFSDSPDLEVRHSELQETDNENAVEDEDYSEDSTLNFDELIIEDISESAPDDEDVVSIIDLDIAQEAETISDPEAVSQVSATGTEADVDSPKSSESKAETRERYGSTPALPVLVPNTSVVIYEPENRKYKPNVFEIMLRPNAYLSKQWLSRTRLYLVLFCLLTASAIALVYSQVQRQPRVPYSLSNKIAFVQNPQDYLDAGNFFLQQTYYRSAIEMYELIRGLDSMKPVLYKNLGFAHFQENQYALSVEAYEYYLKTRKIDTYQPFVAEASYSANERDSQNKDASDYKTYNILGTAYRHLGHLHKARHAYESAIKIAPNEAEAYSNLAELYSDGYQQKPFLTEALAYAAVRLNPDVASYHDTLGWILSKSGRLNKATNVLEQAIRLQSDYVPAHYHLAEIIRKSKQPDKPLQVIRNALVKKVRSSRESRAGILAVLSHIYEADSQKIDRFSASLLRLRGVK